jgi:hypothetical protein
MVKPCLEQNSPEFALGRVLFSQPNSYRCGENLSLTLRDAQHLCWKTFKKFEMADHKNSKDYVNGGTLVKKSNEIEQEIQTIQNSDAPAKKEVFGKLLSELLFGAFVLAEQQGISLEESFLQAIDEMILEFVS